MKIVMCEDFFYRISVNDSEKSIITHLNTSRNNIVRNNKGIPLYAGEWVRVKVNEYYTHIVRPMDTLEKISKIYNIPKEKLVIDNDLKTDKLYIGQSIRIYK